MAELTIPWNNVTSLQNVRRLKQQKPNYQLLLSNLVSRGFNATYLEIGCLGHLTLEAIKTLKTEKAT